MKLLPLLFSVLLLTTTYGQDPAEEDQKTTLGFELDAVPYIFNGYYASAWVGHDHFRYRAVVTKIETPNFILEDGFTNNEMKVYAAIVDYFFKPGFEGWWIGPGLEYWDATIQTDAKLETAEYNNTIVTLGGGYAWKFHKNFYLNPWAAVHLRVAGDKEVSVDQRIYETPLLIPEISLKLGWHF